MSRSSLQTKVKLIWRSGFHLTNTDKGLAANDRLRRECKQTFFRARCCDPHVAALWSSQTCSRLKKTRLRSRRLLCAQLGTYSTHSLKIRANSERRATSNEPIGHVAGSRNGGRPQLSNMCWAERVCSRCVYGVIFVQITPCVSPFGNSRAVFLWPLVYAASLSWLQDV